MSTAPTPEAQYAQAVDTELAALDWELHKLASRKNYAADQLCQTGGATRTSTRDPRTGRRTDGWDLSFSDALHNVQALAQQPADGDDYRPGLAQRRLADWEALLAEENTLHARRSTLRSIYVAHGWSRFFHVTNTNGHIHSSTTCTTCYDTTQYAWVTSLSGQTEAEAVAELGEILCSVCFPSAPAEWTTGESKATKEARAEREAKKAERAAKKVEKALLPEDPEGGYLTLANVAANRASDRITTTHAAKGWLTDYFDWKGYGGDPEYTHPSYSTEDAQNLARLLVGRPGVKETTPEAVLAAAQKRSEKRR